MERRCPIEIFHHHTTFFFPWFFPARTILSSRFAPSFLDGVSWILPYFRGESHHLELDRPPCPVGPMDSAPLRFLRSPMISSFRPLRRPETRWILWPLAGILAVLLFMAGPGDLSPNTLSAAWGPGPCVGFFLLV